MQLRSLTSAERR